MENENLADNAAEHTQEVNSGATSPVADTEQATEEISLENPASEAAETAEEAATDVGKDKPDSLTKTFSDRLNKAREPDKARIAELEAALKDRETTSQNEERLLKIARKMGYTGDSLEDVLDVMEADNSDKTVEEIKAEREALKKKLKEAVENAPKVVEARKLKERIEREGEQKHYDGFVETEFAALQKLDPSVTADKVNPQYFHLLSTGVSRQVAYETVFGKKPGTKPQPEKKQEEQQEEPPVSIGSTGSTGTVEKEFFTEDDVMNMSPEEVKRNYDKIEKSRLSGKWKT